MKKLITITTIILVVCSLSAYAQTKYQTTKSGKFSLSIWGNKQPQGCLPAGDTVVINHDVELDIDLNIDGVLIIAALSRLEGITRTIKTNTTGVLINNGFLSIYTLENNGTIISSDSLVVDHDYINKNGTLTNNSIMICNHDFRNDYGVVTSNYSLEIDHQIVNDSGIIKDNQYMLCSGVIDNKNGNILNVGTLIGKSDFRNAGGIVENNGYISIDQDFDNKTGLMSGTYGDYDINGYILNTSGKIDGIIYLDVCNSNGFTYKLVGSGYINWSTVTICGNILPIQLVSFTPLTVNDHVLIEWCAATEVNNSHFTIERSTDGIDFINIGEVKGAGNSITVNEYSLIDQEPIPGINYYRLKQTNHDGAFGYFPIKQAYFEGDLKNQVSVYPNPFSGKQLQIRFKGFKDEVFEVVIQDAFGMDIYSQFITVESNFQLSSVNPPSTLCAGVYLITVRGVDDTYTQKLMVE